MRRIFLTTLFCLTSACSIFANDSQVHKPKADLATITTFNLIDNRIFINTFINHDGPFKFVFDTGAPNVMTPEVFSKLKTPLKKNDKQITKVDQIQIGQLVFINQEFKIIDLSEIKKALNLTDLDGAFGYQALEEYVVSISYEDQTISLDRELTNEMKEGYQSVDFELVNNRPVISAKINNQTARVAIDTADRSALTIFKNFRGRKQIADIFKNSKEQITSYGLEGPVPALLGRANVLQISSQIEIRNVMARALTNNKGPYATTDIHASIGNEILKQFDLIFDYRDKTLYFKKNENFGKVTDFVPLK